MAVRRWSLGIIRLSYQAGVKTTMTDLTPDRRPRTAREVERFIKAHTGDDVQLSPGRGYWYFSHNASCSWYSSSVGVLRLRSLPLSAWLESYISLRDDYRNW